MLDRLVEVLDVQALVTGAVAFIPGLLAALVILAAFRFAYSLTKTPLVSILAGAGLDRQLVRILVENIYSYALLIFALVMAAAQIGVNVTAALAGIGVVGLAIGFAAQDTLANMIAGFLIFIDKPFVTGDWLHLGGYRGEVSEITMRTTRIRTKQNTWVVIPNKKIIDEVLVNYSKQGKTRIDVPVGIAYKESIPKAREVLLEAAAKLPRVLRDPSPAVVVTGLGDSSVNLQVRVWIARASDEPAVYFAVTEASKLALDAAGIEIPYPHLQLFFDEIRKPVWRSAGEFLDARRTNGQPRGEV